MNFVTEINQILTSDASLNSMVNGGIHYQNMQDNWLSEDLNTEWIIYDISKSIQNSCLQTKNVYTTYALSVLVIQRDTNDNIDEISYRLIDYLNNYESDSMADITFLSDSTSFNQQQQIYTNTLEFICQYVG